MIAHRPIHLAKATDAMQIANLSRVAIEHGLPWGWTESRVRQSIGDASTNVAVLRDKGRVIAFGIMKYGQDTAHLLLLAVQLAHRRLGIGAEVLAWLEKVARTAGIRRVKAEVRADNTAARSFYRKHGYHQTRHVSGMYHGLLDGVCLEKLLW